VLILLRKDVALVSFNKQLSITLHIKLVIFGKQIKLLVVDQSTHRVLSGLNPGKATLD
jgi:hypothetical protein